MYIKPIVVSNGIYSIKGITDNERDPLTGERCYWSNDFGWVTKNFSLYTKEEKDRFSLPVNGKWELFNFSND